MKFSGEFGGTQMQVYADKDKILYHDGSYINIVKQNRRERKGGNPMREAIPFDNKTLIRGLEKMVLLDGFDLIDLSNLGFDSYSEFRSMDASSEDEVWIKSLKHLHLLRKTIPNLELKSFSLDSIPGIEGFNSISLHGEKLWMQGYYRFIELDIQALRTTGKLIYDTYAMDPDFLNAQFLDDGLTWSESGLLLGNSFEGLWIFDPSKFKVNNTAPSLALQSVHLFNEKLPHDKIVLNKEHRFGYNENHLSFVMEAISYARPDAVQYKYKINGLRGYENWFKTDNPEVVFSYLPPGSYSFEFTAENGDGIWQETSLHYNFTIQQPFWKRSQFWLLSILLVALIAFIISTLIHRSKVRNQRAYSQKLLQAFEEERSRLAREIHDSLGQKLTLILRKSKETNNAEITDLASDSLEESRRISKNLHPSSLSKLGFTVAVKELMKQVSMQSACIFDSEIENVDHVLTSTQAIHLYRIIQESISNILKHSGAASASIQIMREKDHLNISIRDDGVGFDINDHNQSLGLKSMEERCNYIDARIKIQSTEGKGTLIDIQI